MNIAVYSSNEFFLGLKIMLTSLLDNNNFERHKIYIITTNFSDKNLYRLNTYLEKKYNQKVTRVVIDEGDRDKFPVSKQFSYSGFHKMYAFRKLAETEDRLMCLDADMVILKSLKEFYYQELDDYYIGACRDSHINRDYIHLEEIGFGKDEKYFNNGCLVLDLKKYTNEYSNEQYIKWINENEEKIKYVAQDVINVLFKGKIKENPYEIYNNQVYSFNNVSDEELQRINRECSILHYVGKIKPWDYRYDGNLKYYTYEVMKKNGMKNILLKIKLKRTFYNIKRKLVK